MFCKKGILKISQNSQLNTYLRVSFLLKFQASVWLWHRCFPVCFTLLIRAPFFIKHLRWLLLRSLYWFVLVLDLPSCSLLDFFCWKALLLDESIKRYSKSVFWINRVIQLFWLSSTFGGHSSEETFQSVAIFLSLILINRGYWFFIFFPWIKTNLSDLAFLF